MIWNRDYPVLLKYARRYCIRLNIPQDLSGDILNDILAYGMAHWEPWPQRWTCNYLKKRLWYACIRYRTKLTKEENFWIDVKTILKDRNR